MSMRRMIRAMVRKHKIRQVISAGYHQGHIMGKLDASIPESGFPSHTFAAAFKRGYKHGQRERV